MKGLEARVSGALHTEMDSALTPADADLDNQCIQLAEERKAIDDFLRTSFPSTDITDPVALREQWQAPVDPFIVASTFIVRCLAGNAGRAQSQERISGTFERFDACE